MNFQINIGAAQNYQSTVSAHGSMKKRGLNSLTVHNKCMLCFFKKTNKKKIKQVTAVFVVI